MLTETYTKQMPCDLHAVGAMCGEAREFFTRAGLIPGEIDAWEVVLAEAANNAVNYVGPEGGQLPIRVDLVATPGEVEVRVTDHTPGFDFPEKAELPPDDFESGRGIFLMQSLTDESCYLRGRRENCLVLRKGRGVRDEAAGGARAQAPAADTGEELREARRTLDLMTEELASSYESLAAIFRFSAELQGDIHSDEFIQRWLKELLAITESDWLVLRLCESAGQQLGAGVSSDAGWRGEPIRLEQTASGTGPIEARAFFQRSDVWFDPGWPVLPGDPIAGLAQGGCGFAHPLCVNDAVVGVLTAGRRDKPQFAAGQVGVIQTFGDFLCLQLRSRQIQEEQVRVRLNTRDLEIAANIQRALLPERLPTVPGISLAGFYRSAREIGGDYYDALPTGDGSILLVVADVMGKGLPAAMFAFMFRSLVRARRELAPQPGQFLAWLNQNLFQELDRAEMFITAQLAFLDCHRREIRIAGAGHPPFLSVNSAGDVREIRSGGPPLGIQAHAAFPEETHALSGSRFLMFTDGLYEARNSNGDLLGLDAVKARLASAGSAAESGDLIQRRFARLLVDFEQGAPTADDTAFIVIAGNDTPLL